MLETLPAGFLAEGEARLDRDGVPASDRRVTLRSVDLRYHGRPFELPITLPPGPLTAADIAGPRRVRRSARAGVRLRGAGGRRSSW